MVSSATIPACPGRTLFDSPFAKRFSTSRDLKSLGSGDLGCHRLEEYVCTVLPIAGVWSCMGVGIDADRL